MIRNFWSVWLKRLRQRRGGQPRPASHYRRPQVEALEDRTVPTAVPSIVPPRFAVGPDTGTGLGPFVQVRDTATNQLIAGFFAFDPSFSGGVRVAMGDINGDGVPDVIVGAGPGSQGGPVNVFDGRTFQLIRSFQAFPGFLGGVYVAAGDVNGDGKDDIIVGAGAGADPHVAVFDGASNALIRSFDAYDPAYTGGVTVAAGHINNDQFDDIVTGSATSLSHVKAFNGADNALIASFLAYPGFNGGVNVSTGDVDGDGFSDIITGTASGPKHIKAFSGLSGTLEMSSLLNAAPGSNGVQVGVGMMAPGASTSSSGTGGSGSSGGPSGRPSGGAVIASAGGTVAAVAGNTFAALSFNPFGSLFRGELSLSFTRF